MTTYQPNAERATGVRSPERRHAEGLAHIYLNDHRAGAAGGLASASRCLRNNEGTALGRELRQLVEDLRTDEASLVAILRHLSIPESRAKMFAARLGEIGGRLKPNGRVRGYSPVSRLLELEMLLAGIDAKRSLWRALAAAEIDVPPQIDLGELVARASSQRERLRPHHEQAATTALG